MLLDDTTTIYTHVLPSGPLGVTSPADTPEPSTDIGLMLRQMETLMKKLTPLAENMPVQPDSHERGAAQVGDAIQERPSA